MSLPPRTGAGGLASRRKRAGHAFCAATHTVVIVQRRRSRVRRVRGSGPHMDGAPCTARTGAVDAVARGAAAGVAGVAQACRRASAGVAVGVAAGARLAAHRGAGERVGVGRARWWPRRILVSPLAAKGLRCIALFTCNGNGGMPVLWQDAWPCDADWPAGHAGGSATQAKPRADRSGLAGRPLAHGAPRARIVRLQLVAPVPEVFGA